MSMHKQHNTTIIIICILFVYGHTIIKYEYKKSTRLVRIILDIAIDIF